METINNVHVYLNHLIPGPMCTCKGGNENAPHFFFHCLNYVKRRGNFVISIPLNLDILLYGADHFRNEENLSIFKAIQKYINDTGRFSQIQ